MCSVGVGDGWRVSCGVVSIGVGSGCCRGTKGGGGGIPFGDATPSVSTGVPSLPGTPPGGVVLTGDLSLLCLSGSTVPKTSGSCSLYSCNCLDSLPERSRSVTPSCLCHIDNWVAWS